MKRFLCLIMLMTSFVSYANKANLNETLVRIINQINAIKPLLNEAKSEINSNARIQLHIERFIDSNGLKHPGLRDDLLSIRNALIDYINHPTIAPRKIKPLAMDFVSKP